MYSKSRSTKDHRQEPATKKIFGRHQDNNAIIEHAVHEIILQENIKLSVKYKIHENIDYEVDKGNLYKLDKMSLDDK